MSATEAPITAERLYFEVPSDRRVELVAGELVPMTPVGFEHGRIVVLLSSLILAFVTEKKLGLVGSEIGFILRRNPDTVRAPDIAFVAAERVSAINRERYFEGAPDLAVEVVSPGDKMSDVQQKIREYLSAGARLVWVIDPGSRTVTAYYPAGNARIYAADEPVPGDDVLPGFSFHPSELFS